MDGDRSIDRDLLLEVVRRSPVLVVLREGPTDRRGVEDRLGISKSASNRNLRSLEERGMVHRTDGEYALTDFGRAIADAVASFEFEVETTVRLEPIFGSVSDVDPPCPLDALDDATVTSATEGDPFGPLARFVDLVRETDTLSMMDSYAIAPTYIDEIYGRVLDGMETRVIERPEVAADVMEHYPRKCVRLCASEYLTMGLDEDLPFGLAILDDRIGIGVRDPETGRPRAFVDTDSPEAREWARAVFEARWADAAPLERFNPSGLEEAVGVDPG